MKTLATPKTLLTALALVALSLGAVQAQGPAQADRAGETHQSSRPAVQRDAPALDIGQIHARLLAEGYTDVREIEWSKGRYKAKARDSQGRRVKLYLNGSTGAMEHSRVHERERPRD